MKRPVITVALGGLLACGDPLVGPEYSGTPLFSLGGAVIQPDARVPSSHGGLELGVFWVGGDGQVEQRARLDSGLAEYTLTLFDPPPVSAFGFVSLVPDRTLAIGVMVLYADGDQVSGLDPGNDLILGAAAQHLLVYLAAPLPEGGAGASVFGPLAAGYHLFAQGEPSTCHFLDAEVCPAQGLPAAADPGLAVPLSLWSRPEQVLVPAPALGPAPLWATP
ncbi:MAG: hypothetical protein IPG45_19315 [Deltaproteobacteria bacterium]|nr:hypothetical protein [Deltaproteobacteria bacterium]